MVLGIYYLTLEKPGDKGEGKFFHNINEAILAYENKVITFQSRIKVRKRRLCQWRKKSSRVIESTLGRFIFNEIIPQDLGFVNRALPENDLVPEIDFLVGKKQLKQIIDKCINTHGATKTAEVLDLIKSTGYKYSTVSAITVSVSDMTVPGARSSSLRTPKIRLKRLQRTSAVVSQRKKNVIKRLLKHGNRPMIRLQMRCYPTSINTTIFI